jgi:tRNA-specific 2-thiouridylase
MTEGAGRKVIVGMSGGVDSSVAALLLKRAGYDVAGLFMRNWRETGADGVCTAEADFADVRAVCGVVGIPYYAADFSREYADRVFTRFIDEYRRGRTPNPDVLCNREIKFGPFLDTARGMGADTIATGHYCGVRRENGDAYLLRARDEGKDQTYFLHQLRQDQLKSVLFPLSDMLKSEVRRVAADAGIPVAEKKDSTGVCFIGERDFKPFLKEYIGARGGDICTPDGAVVGRHDGLPYYTTGQRRGLGIGGVHGAEGRWFVVGKDEEKNILYVTCGEGGELLSRALVADELNFIPRMPEVLARGGTLTCMARLRHRQPLFGASVRIADGKLYAEFSTPQRAVTRGQFAVFYDGEICIGGGVIDGIVK